MKRLGPALAFAAALAVSLAVACGSSDGGPAATVGPGETRESDCRPTTEHVPYDAPLPTLLPYGIKLGGACVMPGPPAEGLLDLREVQFSFSNPDDTAGFLLITTPVDLSGDGMTPIAIGDQQAFTNTSPRDAESANFWIQLRRNDLTYIITATMSPEFELTEEDVLRIAESIP
jgi:hypothetical protein